MQAALHHPGVVTTLGLDVVTTFNLIVQTYGRSATAGVSLVQQLTDGGFRGMDLFLLPEGV